MLVGHQPDAVDRDRLEAESERGRVGAQLVPVVLDVGDPGSATGECSSKPRSRHRFSGMVSSLRSAAIRSSIATPCRRARTGCGRRRR